MIENDTEKQLRMLSAAMTIHHSIGANLELDKIGSILVQELTAIVPCEGCAILLFDDKKVGILAESGFRVKLDEKVLTTDLPALQQIVSTKQSVTSGDIAKSPLSSCVPADCVMKSMICTPIMVNGAVKGAIHIDSLAADAFTKDDLHFVELLTKEISLAVARSLQYSSVKAMAVRDPLTECYNRRKFDEDLSLLLSRCSRYERPLSLLIIDIDWFKAYNDFHGHPRGDELIKEIAAFFSRAIRFCDQLYRYGGEEFVIILPETDSEGALVLARRICILIEQQTFAGASESQPGKRLTVSIGVANVPADGKSREELLQAADSALYKAKQSGRNRVCSVGDG